MMWSNPVSCDLTRTESRVSVPKSLANEVPKLPGVYVIVQLDKAAFQERILDIGMAGPRSGMGLRGRIASCVEHSACQRIAKAIGENVMTDALKVMWLTNNSGLEAKRLEEGMLALFREEFSKVPLYNGNGGNTVDADMFRPEYDALKQHIMAL